MNAEELARFMHEKGKEWHALVGSPDPMPEFETLNFRTLCRYYYVTQAVLDKLQPIAEEVATHDIGGEG